MHIFVGRQQILNNIYWIKYTTPIHYFFYESPFVIQKTKNRVLCGRAIYIFAKSLVLNASFGFLWKEMLECKKKNIDGNALWVDVS